MYMIILTIIGCHLIRNRCDTIVEPMVSVMVSARYYEARYYSRNPLAAATRQLSQPPQSWSAP